MHKALLRNHRLPSKLLQPTILHVANFWHLQKIPQQQQVRSLCVIRGPTQKRAYAEYLSSHAGRNWVSLCRKTEIWQRRSRTHGKNQRAMHAIFRPVRLPRSPALRSWRNHGPSDFGNYARLHAAWKFRRQPERPLTHQDARIISHHLNLRLDLIRTVLTSSGCSNRGCTLLDSLSGGLNGFSRCCSG